MLCLVLHVTYWLHKGLTCNCVGIIVPSLLCNIKYFGNNSSGPTRQFATRKETNKQKKTIRVCPVPCYAPLSFWMNWLLESRGVLRHPFSPFPSSGLSRSTDSRAPQMCEGYSPVWGPQRTGRLSSDLIYRDMGIQWLGGVTFKAFGQHCLCLLGVKGWKK